jgi:phosphoglycerate dehydrogenase-like enzyme
LHLHPQVKRLNSLRELASVSDYVSIHVPFIKGVTENLINDNFFLYMKASGSAVF